MLVLEERSRAGGWIQIESLLFFCFLRKLEDNIFKVVQLFMCGDSLQALLLLIQQD